MDISRLTSLSPQALARIAGVVAGLVFGVFWIPIRALDEAGFPAIWATTVFNGAALIAVAPLLFWRLRSFVGGGARFHLAGLLAGLTFALYAASFMYTEVVRAILLFYLTPVWGFAMARIFLGEAMTPVRWISILLGLSGMAVILGVEAGLPLPRSAGDWMALISGICWAVTSTMILTDRKCDPVNYGLAFFLWGAIIVLAFALIFAPEATVDWTALADVAWWLIPVTVLIVAPAGFATLYAPTQLSPGVVGLLFMSEIGVAAVTAAILAGEPFGLREIFGVTAIALAGFLEPLAVLARKHT